MLSLGTKREAPSSHPPWWGGGKNFTCRARPILHLDSLSLLLHYMLAPGGDIISITSLSHREIRHPAWIGGRQLVTGYRQPVVSRGAQTRVRGGPEEEESPAISHEQRPFTEGRGFFLFLLSPREEVMLRSRPTRSHTHAHADPYVWRATFLSLCGSLVACRTGIHFSLPPPFLSLSLFLFIFGQALPALVYEGQSRINLVTPRLSLSLSAVESDRRCSLFHEIGTPRAPLNESCCIFYCHSRRSLLQKVERNNIPNCRYQLEIFCLLISTLNV